MPAKRNLRLFCFPYAGGNQSTFRNWQSLLLPHVVLHAVDLPGRNRRFKEPLVSRLADLVPQLAWESAQFLDSQICLFGHSLGALIAFEFARELRRTYGIVPTHLFVSGCPAPQLLRTVSALHTLRDASFLRRIGKLIPTEAKQNKDLMSLMLPVLRSDFALYETYDYVPEPPLDCPISALGGSSDLGIRRSELRGWESQTTSSFKLQMFPGDHFFFRKNEKRLLEIINQQLKLEQE